MNTATGTTKDKKNNAAANTKPQASADVTPKTSERDYLNRYIDVKEKVIAALPEKAKREYVMIMTLFFPKYDTKENRNLLRKVFNGLKRDNAVLDDFELLAKKLIAVQEAK